MTIRKGDIVNFLNDVGRGKVVQVDGKLKNEVRQILKREYANKVEFHDADFSKYEEGATLVIII